MSLPKLKVLIFSAIFSAAFLFTVASASAQNQLSSSEDPIDITADALEVQQDKNIAIWTGTVKAVQGQMILESDKLEVYYTNNESGSSNTSAIHRIDARGNVKVTSPDEVATGLKGTYDLAKRTITLIDNVVLVRGSNILNGDRLIVELDTGLSRLISDQGSGGRVSGTFKSNPNQPE